MVVGVLLLQRLIFFSLFPFSHKLSIRFRNANGVVRSSSTGAGEIRGCSSGGGGDVWRPQLALLG